MQLEEMRRKEEEQLAQTLSVKYGVSYINLRSMGINTDALRIIDEQKARALNVVVFGMVGKKINVAALAPGSDDVQNLIAELGSNGYEPSLFITSKDSLERAWEHYKDLSFAAEAKAGSLDISNEEILKIMEEVKSIKDTATLFTAAINDKKKMRTSRITEIMVAGAMNADASDIHVEPEESYVRLRYRLDGVLNDIVTFDRATYQLILSRVKLLSGLKLNVKDEAQDGRFSVKLNGVDIEIRTSILPGGYGEAIVLRLLNPKTIGVPLEELGINPKLLALLLREIDKPNGMILTTGPTGSGKTTTLYAFLKKVYTPAIKVITIEDPIEYHLPGVVQTQTDDKGYTFSAGLRSALRQDPDVIMVGEIRDGETAEIAINASLTGHLVFSTLHTNNAAGAYPRLIELGVNPKIISSSVTIAMAQRLVRKLCPVCRKQVPLEGENLKTVERIIKSVPKDTKIPESKMVWEAVGCIQCNNTGYKGRKGIYEAIKTDKTVEDVVTGNPSEREIATAAAAQGLLTMQQDGIIKVLEGVTSLSELGRVIDLDVSSWDAKDEVPTAKEVPIAEIAPPIDETSQEKLN